MCCKMFAVGNRGKLPDGSEVEILDYIEDRDQYRVFILSGPPVLMSRQGKLVQTLDLTVPAEIVKPLVTVLHDEHMALYQEIPVGW